MVPVQPCPAHRTGHLPERKGQEACDFRCGLEQGTKIPGDPGQEWNHFGHSFPHLQNREGLYSQALVLRNQEAR